MFTKGVNQDEKWETVQDSVFSSAINLEPDVANNFSVLVSGSDFMIFVNGEQLTVISDSTLSNKGKIGLGIEVDKNETLTVDFDNLVINGVP